MNINLKHITKLSAPPLRILVLGDLHFGQFAEHPDFMVNKPSDPHDGPHTVSMKRDFLNKIKASDYDLVLVPGDLTSIACPAEFEIAKSFLNEVSAHLNLEDDMFHTFGNHDVNWMIGDLGDVASPHKEQVLGYQRIASEIGSILFPPKNLEIKGPLPGCGIVCREKYDLIILNSSYECHRNQTVKSGKIGEQQRVWLEHELKNMNHNPHKWRLVMVHHHPHQLSYPAPWPDYSAIEDGDELLTILGHYGCDFLVHGHRHHPKTESIMKSGWKHPITIFCAGSFGVDSRHRANGHIDNTFHITSLESKHTATNACLGTIRTFFFSLRGWKETTDNLHEEEYTRGGLPSPVHFGSIANRDSQKEELRHLLDYHSEDVNSEVAGGTLFKLPEKVKMPPDLRTCSIPELNKMLLEVCKEKSVQILKEFPEAPLFLKNKSTKP